MWRLYPEIHAGVKNSMDAQTLVLWAGAEAAQGNGADAERLMDQAEAVLKRIPGNLEAGVIRNQVQMIRAEIQKARALPRAGSSAGADLLSPVR